MRAHTRIFKIFGLAAKGAAKKNSRGPNGKNSTIKPLPGGTTEKTTKK